MHDGSLKSELRRVHPSDKSAISTVIEVLSAAFKLDPIMVYFTSDRAADNRDFVRRKIIKALITSHTASGEPVFGYFHQDRLVGCAIVDARSSGWRTALGLVCSLPNWLRLPIGCIRKLNAYGAVSRVGIADGATFFW